MNSAEETLRQTVDWLRADHEKLVRRVVELETWIHTLQGHLDRLLKENAP